MNNILYYPKEYLTTPPHILNNIINGCGPGGWLIDIVPDHIFFCNITEACYIHDFMYKVGTTIEDKKRADRVFLNNMTRLILDKNYYWYDNWLKKKRLALARFYYVMVKNHGGPAFWRGKDDPKDKEEEEKK